MARALHSRAMRSPVPFLVAAFVCLAGVSAPAQSPRPQPTRTQPPKATPRASATAQPSAAPQPTATLAPVARPEFRPAVLPQGPTSLINRIDVNALLQKGQKDGAVQFSAIV